MEINLKFYIDDSNLEGLKQASQEVQQEIIKNINEFIKLYPFFDTKVVEYFQNLILSKDLDKIFNDDEFIHLLNNFKKCMKLQGNIDVGNGLFSVISNILNSKNRISLKNAWLQASENDKSNLTFRLNGIIFGFYELVMYYEYILFVQVFNFNSLERQLSKLPNIIKTCNEINEINKNIDNNYISLHPSEILNIIRNGLAHNSLIDVYHNKALSMQELKHKSFIKIKSKDNSKCIYLNGEILDNLIQPALDLSVLNEKSDLYKDLKPAICQDSNTHNIDNINYDNEKLNNLFAYTKSPSFVNFIKYVHLSRFIEKDLNSNRNKNVLNVKDGVLLLQFSDIIFLFKALSVLKKENKTKLFAQYLYDNRLFEKLPLFKDKYNKKSISNKLRTLRNSIAHGNYVADEENLCFKFSDFDENLNKEFEVGELDFINAIALIEEIERFVINEIIQEINMYDYNKAVCINDINKNDL